jgi:hypothetical protein
MEQQIHTVRIHTMDIAGGPHRRQCTILDEMLAQGVDDLPMGWGKLTYTIRGGDPACQLLGP